MRRFPLGLVLTICVAAVAIAIEPPTLVAEDWSRQPRGRTGIPESWNGQSWGNPQYDLTVVTDGSDRVLHLRSRGDNSTISKKIKVDVKELPLLVWRWKAVALPVGGDCRRKATDDQAAQIYVAFPRFPTAVRSRIIGYVWDSTVPAGTICKSEKTGTVTYVVIRSGPADLGKWFTERRNVAEDFKKIYGADADGPAAMSIAIDSNDTNSTAESFMGAMLFRRP
jgi:hypothetical protein